MCFILYMKTPPPVCQIWSRFRLQHLGQKRTLLLPSPAVRVPLEPGSPGRGVGLRAGCSSGRGSAGWIHAHIRSLLPVSHEKEAGPCEKRRGRGQRARIRPAAPHAQHWYNNSTKKLGHVRKLGFERLMVHVTFCHEDVTEPSIYASFF